MRFDFTYPDKITDEEVVMVENLVNEKINTKVDSKTNIMKLEDAKKSGAVHMFDEKYDDIVRVVTLYNSVELCGGTHVKNVGDIKSFAIMSIESKGANVYRIEATTDTNIVNELYKIIKPYNDEMVKLLTKAKGIIDEAKAIGLNLEFNVEINNDKPLSYKDIVFNKEEVMMVRNKVKDLEKLFNLKKQKELLTNDTAFDEIEEINGKKFIIKKVSGYDINTLKLLIDNAFNKMGEGIIFIANVNDNNVNFICKSNTLDAGSLIRAASVRSNGNGGGSSAFGQGGGTDSSKVDEILESVKNQL